MVESLPALPPRDAQRLETLGLPGLPALISKTGAKGARAFLDFFAASIENDNTRKAYLKAVCDFLEQCETTGIKELAHLQPFMVGAYMKKLELDGASKPSRKLKLAGIRRFFDHLVMRQVIETNPALSVRGPKLKITKGKTKPLTLEELQQLLAAIDRSTLVGKRDFAWFATAMGTWCRVSALAKLKVSDYSHSGKRSFLSVQEKGGNEDRMPVHHKAQEALDELIATVGLGGQKEAPIFQSVDREGRYTGRPLSRHRVFEMVRRRARQAGITKDISCHSFRATGITEFLKAGGRLDRAQRRAHHADSRTTKVYDHSDEDVSLEDIELVQF